MATILFLGAGSDMALATARVFAQKGYHIQLAGRNAAYLEKVRRDFAIRYETTVTAHFFDALDFTSHGAFIHQLPELPDITVCAFGYLGDQQAAQNDWDEARRIMDTNYTGAVSVLNHIANAYEQQRKGIIVGISSVAGDRGRKSNYIYGSAKAGFSAYLSGLRNRLSSHGVHVVSVKPGFVATKMTEGLSLPASLTAKPEQVAKAIFAATEKRKNTVYIKGIWKYIMLIIRLIPESIFKKMNL